MAPNRPSHFPSTPNFSELSLLFTAFSETSQKFARTPSLTPLFSISQVHGFVNFWQPAKIYPVFATTSQNTPGVPPLPPKNPGVPDGCGLYLQRAWRLERLRR